MHKTPLHQFHLDHGAKMVEFAGWQMPLTYGDGLQAEHHQTRSSGGLFDVSHMGRVQIKGRHARRLIERVCTRRVSDMGAGQCRYSFVCNDRGGVMDDVIVYRYDDDDFMIVVNASNREKLLAHFEKTCAESEFKVNIEDRTTKTAMVAIQGPKVMDLIGRISTEVPTLKRFRFTVKNLVIMKLTVSRTGYTGEDGVEVILPATGVGLALKLLLKDAKMDGPDAIINPVGLGARDTLRTEAGYPLYGHELTEEISALACGMNFALNIDKDQDERGEPYIGMEAIKRTRDEGGPRRILAGLNVDGKRSARQNMIVKSDGREIGIVTSGCPSPTLNRCIAMAYLDRDDCEVGKAVTIDTGRGTLEATVAKLPFYTPPKG